MGKGAVIAAQAAILNTSVVAACTFTGVVAGKEKTFTAGDPITADEATEMGLASKPDLTEKGSADAS